VGIALGVVGGLIVIGAVVQGVRRWRQGDRMPALIAGGVVAAGFAAWGLVVLLASLGIGGQ
jgi:hypothetical protein